MIKRILFGFFIAFILLSGCAPKIKKTVEPVEQIRPRAGLPIELIDGKIDFLQEILAKEHLSNTDRDVVLQLLDSYKLLKKSLAGHIDDEQLRELVFSLSKSLSNVDESFLSRERVSMPSERETATRLLKERDRIMELYRQGDYRGVIRDCLQLRSEFGSDAISLELGLAFALSLGEEGKLQEAIQLGEGIARQLEKSPGLTVLRTHIARWQLQLGNRNGALTTYEQLTGNLDETAALLKALKADMDTRVTPEREREKIKSEESGLPASGRGDEEKSTEQVIEESRSLVRENRYDEARQLLLNKRKSVEQGPESQELESALMGVGEAQKKFEEEKAIRDAYVKKTLDAAGKLIESDNFEEGIQKLETISKVQEKSSEATLLRERAVEGIINRDRNKAAQLFLSARKAGDVSKKEALLKSALQILENLAEKYPSSDLKDKVLSNMSRVQDELKKLNGNQ